MRHIVVPHIAMTTNTLQRFIRDRMLDSADSRLVTFETIFLGDLGVELTNLDMLRIRAQGEGKAVVEAVDALDDPFVGKSVRRVTVITGGDSFMGGVAPPVKLLAHNVAIQTSVGIAGKIGESFGVDKGEGAETHQYTKHQGKSRQPVTATASWRGIIGHGNVPFLWPPTKVENGVTLLDYCLSYW